MQKQQEKAELKSLIAFGVSESMRYQSDSVSAFKSGTLLAACNRAIINNAIDCAELKELHNFYANVPYMLWIKDGDTAAKNTLIEDGFSYEWTSSLMAVDLNALVSKVSKDSIFVRRVKNDDELFNIWVPIVVQSFFPDLKNDAYKHHHMHLTVFIKYLQNTIPLEDLFFYLGFLNDVPAATGMFWRNQDLIGVHWIGTLPDFRGKGVGFAVTHLPLHELKAQGAQRAILFASLDGYSMYEKMGFRTLANYEAYARQ